MGLTCRDDSRRMPTLAQDVQALPIPASFLVTASRSLLCNPHHGRTVNFMNNIFVVLTVERTSQYAAKVGLKLTLSLGLSSAGICSLSDCSPVGTGVYIRQTLYYGPVFTFYFKADSY